MIPWDLVPVFIAAILALCGAAMELNGIYYDRQKRISDCEPHHWEYRSLDNLDHQYERICIRCPKRESVKKEDVPHHERAKRRGFRG